MKSPKRGSERTVPKAVEDILNELQKIAISTAPDAYIFASIQCPGKPLGETFFRNAFARELESIGIPGGVAKQGVAISIFKNDSFEILRHGTFTQKI